MKNAALDAADAIRDRERWLAWRRQGLGGSDAAVVLGIDAFRSPVELWLDKLGQLPDEPSEAMELGSALEPVIAERFEHKTGLAVRDSQLCVKHPERPWMRCTVDGLTGKPDGPDEALYEAKATSGWGWRDGIPDHVLVQVQHNLEVCGLERCWLAVLRGDRMALHVSEIERDREVGAAIAAAEEAFWTRYILGRVCPPALGTTGEEQALREAYAEADAALDAVDLGDDSGTLLGELLSAQAAIREQETVVKRARNALMARMGSAQVGTCQGEVAVTWKEVVTQRLDASGLKSAHPDIVAAWTKPSKSRRFSVAKANEEEEG